MKLDIRFIGATLALVTFKPSILNWLLGDREHEKVAVRKPEGWFWDWGGRRVAERIERKLEQARRAA